MDCDNQKSQNAGYTFPNYPLYPYQVGATGGASCGQTEPAIQKKANCAQAPRQGYNDMANYQLKEIVERRDEHVLNELIRAREIGQREGREDEERQNNSVKASLRAQIADLQKALQVLQRPIMFEVDPRVAGLQTRLTSLQYSMAALERMNGNQAATITKLNDENDRLKRRIGMAVTLITK